MMGRLSRARFFCAAFLVFVCVGMCAGMSGHRMMLAAEVPHATLPSDGPRNIYVGDIITLDVQVGGMPEEEIRKRFEDFEIMDLRRDSESFSITMRSFEPGEKKIYIGNKEIVISVRSLLEDLDRDGIFEGDMSIEDPGFSVPWLWLFGVAAGVFAGFGGVYVYAKFFRGRRSKSEPPYDRFARRSRALSVTNERFFVELTFYFKEYLESFRGKRLIGKTASEIMEELQEVPAVDPVREDTRAWFSACDRWKFSGDEASHEDKDEHLETLFAIVKKMEKHRSAPDTTTPSEEDSSSQPSEDGTSAQPPPAETTAKGDTP